MPSEPARTGAADILFETVASLFSAGALAYAAGAGARWVLDLLYGTQGLQDLARWLMGALVGLVIGAPLGPWVIARYRERRFSVWLGYAGAALGAAAGLVAVVVLARSNDAGAAAWVTYGIVVAATVASGNLRRTAR